MMGATTSICGSWILEFDGLCAPRNPGGIIGIGWLLDADGETITGFSSQAAEPKNTNNNAEWYALGFGLLEAAKQATVRPKPELLVIRGDSQLVIEQLNKRWRAKVPLHAACRDRCLQLIEQIGVKWEATWVAREFNQRADDLSKQAYFARTGTMPPDFHRRRVS